MSMKDRTGSNFASIHGRSMINLQALKKQTQNVVILKNNFMAGHHEHNYSSSCVSRSTTPSRLNYRSTSKGKLVLGKNSKPSLLLTREERHNPWGKKGSIDEEVLLKKGMLELISMGVISKRTNCGELLNNHYQVIQKESEPQTFLTNPAAIINTYYQSSRLKEEEGSRPQMEMVERERIEQKPESSNKSVKIRKGKKKGVKKEEQVFIPIEDKIKLTLLNYEIERNQIYTAYLKGLKASGMQLHFKIFLSQMTKFATKHNLSKITFTPILNQTKKLTQTMLLSCIQHHKILGIDLRVKGQPKKILSNLVRMRTVTLRYSKIKDSLRVIEMVKNHYKTKKFYRDMIGKRWQFINYKLGAFAQSQRRLIQQNLQYPLRPAVQIHILTISSADLPSYYKLENRLKSQLTRLFNTDSTDIILLNANIHHIQTWLNDIATMQSTWRKPKIHLIQCGLKGGNLQGTSRIYFGLTKDIILRIKDIVRGKTAAVFPYELSSYLPRVCQLLGVGLYAGNYTKESIASLFEEDKFMPSSQSRQIISQGEGPSPKFTKIIANSLQYQHYAQEQARKIANLQLANKLLADKLKCKHFFTKQAVQTPIWIQFNVGVDKEVDLLVNISQFYLMFARFIISNRQISRWMIKIPNCRFSRGIAILQTDSLKILSEAKRKPAVMETDVVQIASILQEILIQKIIIPHNSLWTGEEFVGEFKSKGGYVQAVVQGCSSPCVFGRVQMNGLFTILGTYRKYYAENVCCGAMYPASELTPDIFKTIQKLSHHLCSLNIFGYFTFQLLFKPPGSFYFIDLQPHLQSFSSLYFMYKRMFQISDLDIFTNTLKKCIFYAPFIDNNGSKCSSIADFQMQCKDKKIGLNTASMEGQKFMYLNEPLPDVLSLITFAVDEIAAIKMSLQALTFLIDSGGEFNKFDKKSKTKRSDGLYIMDILWKLRKLKKMRQKTDHTY